MHSMQITHCLILSSVSIVSAVTRTQHYATKNAQPY